MKIKFNKTRKISYSSISSKNEPSKKDLIMQSIELMPEYLLDDLMTFIQYLDFKYYQGRNAQSQMSVSQTKQEIQTEQANHETSTLEEEDFFDVEV